MSSVTHNTFDFFLSGSIWSANFTCGCKWCTCVSGMKGVTADLAGDTAILYVVKHLRQIYAEAID